MTWCSPALFRTGTVANRNVCTDCRQSIEHAQVVQDVTIFLDLLQRVGMVDALDLAPVDILLGLGQSDLSGRISTFESTTSEASVGAGRGVPGPWVAGGAVLSPAACCGTVFSSWLFTVIFNKLAKCSTRSRNTASPPVRCNVSPYFILA